MRPRMFDQWPSGNACAEPIYSGVKLDHRDLLANYFWPQQVAIGIPGRSNFTYLWHSDAALILVENMTNLCKLHLKALKQYT